MASSSNLSVNTMVRVKKHAEVTYYPKYCNCGVQACAMVSTTSENLNELFWTCKFKKSIFCQWATKEDMEMRNNTSGHGMNQNEDVIKISEWPRYI